MSKERVLRTVFDKRSWLIILALGAIYLAANLALPRLPVNSYVKGYFLPAFLWLGIFFLVWRLPRYQPAGKISARSGLIQMALVLGISQVVFYALGGLITSFGKSPYSFTPHMILLNLLLNGSILIGMEFSRAWLLNHFGKRPFLALSLISILYAIMVMTLSQLTGMKASVETVNFTGSYLLPVVAESLLASLLALLAGPLASLCYRGILTAFWVFCPILPNLSWSIKGLIGVLVPILGMVIIWQVYTATTLHGKVKKQSRGGFPLGWIITAVAAVLIIWFSVGIFPVHPVLVITGSMAPTINPGDLAIVAKSNTKDFEVGEIIEFRKSEEVNIVHRVVAVNNTGGAKTYVTKGDANDEADIDPVLPDNVVGRVVFRVPKIGWAADSIKRIFVR